MNSDQLIVHLIISDDLVDNVTHRPKDASPFQNAIHAETFNNIQGV